MKKRGIVLALLLLLSVGCSAAEAGGGPATSAARQDMNLLEYDDISRFANAFQAVQGLRSQWLRLRAASGFGNVVPVKVYRDGVQLGGVEALERMPTLEIASIRYFDGRTASQRWGLGHDNGVIFVTSRNR